jgi:heptosyltransferase-2
MTLPAVTALRRRLPAAWIVLLVKPGMAPLWTLCPTVDEVITLGRGWRGVWRTVQAVRARGFDFAYILPQSFRSAWVPWLARVPGRKGLPGHSRDWMLTETVRPPEGRIGKHQADAYRHLMGLDNAPAGAAAAPLHVDATARAQARSRLATAFGVAEAALNGPLVGLFPGAAYGPSKRWPAERFAAVGRGLAAERGCRLVVLGAPGERVVCEEVARAIGPGAVSLAGTLSVPDLAAVLAELRAVVANDSGGLHLAAALGVPVVALFGITDPDRTGPLGAGHTILAAEGFVRGRDLPRASPMATAALAAIGVDAVVAAAARALEGGAPSPPGRRGVDNATPSSG